MKVSKKLLNSVHASVDELAAANPEALTALATIFESMMQSSTAVTVSAKKGSKKSSAKVAVDELDDDLEDGDEGEDDDLEEDEEEEEEEEEGDDELEEEEEEEEEAKPARRGKAKAKTSAKPAKGRKAKVVEEEEEEEEAEASTIDLENLETDTIVEAFESFTPSEDNERVNPKAGIRELSGELDELGFDTDAILKQAKAKTPADKKAAFAEILNRVHFTIDAIMEFELESITDAIDEFETDFKPKGRGKAKELSAATELFRLAIFGADE